MSDTATRLTPVLTHIQSHLDQDLSLDDLAAVGGMSPFHFHRVFRDAIGETVKQYTLRLRLERAAYWLKIQDSSIVDVAFQMGFNAHETFSRAFKRQFGVTPKQFRRENFVSKAEMRQLPAEFINRFTEEVELSQVRIVKLQPLKVAFIRCFGAYEQADHTLFDQLTGWAMRTGRYADSRLLVGVGHDDPSITPTEKVRYDACITVEESFNSDTHVNYQELPNGYYAMLTYVGPWDSNLYAGYGKLFETVSMMDNYTMVGLPAIEIYRTTTINPAYKLNHTDIYLPVEKVAG